MQSPIRPAMIAALLLVAAAADASADPAAATFSTEVRIEIDRDGKVADVVSDRELPAPLARAVREHVSSWRFQSPRVDGRAVGGTTYAHLSGCAVPSADGLTLAFGTSRTGPGHGQTGIIGTHVMPMPAGLASEGRFTVNAGYRVQPDGTTQVESVRSDGFRSKAVRELEQAIARWLATRRFQPERIDGHPVATRMALPMHYDLRKPRRQASRSAGNDSATCGAAAAGPAPHGPVAVDSPFVPAPAG